MAIRKMTKAEKSWIMYDVGNSAFVLLSTALIPVYFSSIATGNVVVAWGYAETIASLAIALVMPVLGSLADMKGMRKKFVAGTVGTGAVACVALGLPSSAFVFLLVYVIASIMLNSSMVFYDALLVDATDEDRFDIISSNGYAWGYLGSTVPFIACLGLVLGAGSIGLSTPTAMKLAFAITALWWIAFTIPLMRNVHQSHFKERPERLFADSFKGLLATLKNIWSETSLRYFILAYFFYIDGVHTIIRLSTSYGADLGISSTQLVLALLVTQFVAFPSAIVYGRMGARFGTKRMLLVGILGYAFITFFAALFLRSAVEFWILAIMVGLFQGGIQALSRSEFGKLVPKEHANEYFGFFDIFGKYASVMGTFLVSTITVLTGMSSIGVFSLVLLFAVGFVFMWKVPDSVRADGASQG
ncbi:MAG: MFS transporter [Slackia sp.]|uniref:MFS transporter n=1 Tax=uncultured Slackia sp. TaxID=665903 RepID=UPI002803BC61|nr:MFS transporter [uncultured Slackia sp.]MDU6011687.1 MFS transporter [Slackia sp.]